MFVYKTRASCRLCDGPFEDVLNLGDIHLSTFLGTNEELPPKAPLDLVRCQHCDLFQLRHTVDQDAMYSQYWYKSGLNNSMKEALKNVVACVEQRKELKTDSIALDIGANDGTLLSFYHPKVFRVACEPSSAGADIPRKDADIIIRDYFSAGTYFDRIAMKADVVTAIAMFYDLEDPHTFVADLKKVLAEDGLLVIQMMDLMSMIKTNDFPNLCHEHLEYYSLNVLCDLLWQHGLDVFDLEYNGVNGGSLRVYVRHDPGNDHYEPIVDKALTAEYRFFNQSHSPVEAFKENVSSIKQKLIAFIAGANSLGDDVAVLGASTKGNTMLQYFGLTDAEIDHAAEVNPEKFGKRTVGSNIPIVSEDESWRRDPAYYLILPWGFTDFFVEKLRDRLKEGLRLISPLPEPRVIWMDLKENIRVDYL